MEIYRRPDTEFILSTAAEGHSTSIVGLSNVGKSMLLRAACQPEVQAAILNEQTASQFILVYVDCNLMLTLTAQGFYEVAVRAMQEMLVGINASEALVTRLNELYRKVVEPVSEFVVPLSFSEAIEVFTKGLDRQIVFLLDEFDDPFIKLDSRVFLNLRALSDKFGKHLSYVVATTKPLKLRSDDQDVSEFVELFSTHRRMLGMLSDGESRRLAGEWSSADGSKFDEHELDFVVEQAGGHPGLIRAVTRVLLNVGSGALVDARSEGLALARVQLEDDPVARAECSKLWNQISPSEQDALIELVVAPAARVDPKLSAALIDKGLLRAQELRLFCAHFAGFVHRQRRARRSEQAGVWVDVDAGEVTVDGRKIPTLTELEYRLVLLLWGRLNKLCDKYQIVESVWGQDYIDEVDDARVEKLVSRLRAKLEEDPSNPRHLQTVRGRGYRLVNT